MFRFSFRFFLHITQNDKAMAEVSGFFLFSVELLINISSLDANKKSHQNRA
jgi:hypothetical protein